MEVTLKKGGDAMLADNMRKCRETLDWSQEDLARHTDGAVRLGTVNRIENGSNTTTDTLEKLAAAFRRGGLDISAGDLLSNSGTEVTHDNAS